MKAFLQSAALIATGILLADVVRLVLQVIFYVVFIKTPHGVQY